MITENVLGAYAALGGLPPDEQAAWYRKSARDWGISSFEIPFFAQTPLAPELAQAFTDLSASLVVTLVAQWATVGQKDPSYGFASLNESSRQTTLMDACAALQPCRALSQQGVRIRNVVVQTGQRAGEPIPHAIAFHRSLIDLHRLLSAVLPDTALAVEVTDTLPLDHPIPFPAAKKASLGLSDLIQTLSAVNRTVAPRQPISLMVNWGRLLVNGDRPLDGVQQILASEVPLAGVILSGAGASPNGFMDAHNSHLDPDSGFTAADAQACASALKSSPQSSFLGMKCSRAKGSEQVSVDEVLTAQAKLLGQIA